MVAVARLMPVRTRLYTLLLIVIAGTAAWLGASWFQVLLYPDKPDAMTLVSFYPAEGDQQPYQFSRGTSHILLSTIPQAPTKLTMRVRSPLPLPTRPLSITYNQQSLAQITLHDQARVLSILVPQPTTQSRTQGALFSFATKSVGIPGDVRRLGFAFDAIAVTSLSQTRISWKPWLAIVPLLMIAIIASAFALRRHPTFMQRWSKPNIDAYTLAVAVVCVVYTAFFAWISIYKYQLFQAHAYDLGVYDQTLWLISRGYLPYNTTMGVHLLGNHGALLVYPLALLYLIVPDVRALLILQSVVIALGGWMLYRLGQARAYSAAGMLVACAYLLHPAVQHMNMTDFHPDALAATALIAAFWCADRRRWALMLVACVIVLTAKENFGLTVAAFGLWLALQRHYRWGLIVVIISMSWFFIVTKSIEPYYNGLGRPVHLDRYSIYGHSMSEILTTFATNPQLVLKQVLLTSKLWYVLYLTLPFGLLCWLSPRTLIVAVPALALNIITDYAAQTDLQSQYEALIVPVLAVALLQALQYFKSTISRTQITMAFTTVLAMAGTLFVHNAVPAASAEHLYAMRNTATARRPLYDYALSLIPPNANLMAQSRLQPHLAHRQQAFLFPTPFTTERFTNVRAMPFTPSIEYIVYDTHDRLSPYLSNREVTRILADAQKQQPYTTMLSLDGIMVLKRAAP